MKLRLALCFAILVAWTDPRIVIANDLGPSPKSTKSFGSPAGKMVRNTQLAFAQKSKSKGAKGTPPSSSNMPSGYPGLPGSKGSGNGPKQPPAGSTMQPPPNYPTSGSTSPIAGKGKPPPGSSLSGDLNGMPGYGSDAPKIDLSNPPPGSALGMNSGYSGKPSNYPTSATKQTGPPSGSSMSGPNPAYVSKIQKTQATLPVEAVVEKPVTVTAPVATAKQIARQPVTASRLMNEFQGFYCSNCDKAVAANDTKCPHCGAEFDEVMNADGSRTHLKSHGSASFNFSAPNVTILALGLGLAVSFFAFVIGLVAVLVKKSSRQGR